MKNPMIVLHFIVFPDFSFCFGVVVKWLHTSMVFEMILHCFKTYYVPMTMLHVILLPVFFSFGFRSLWRTLYTLNDLQMTIHCFETNLDRASFSWANDFMTVHCSCVQHQEKKHLRNVKTAAKGSRIGNHIWSNNHADNTDNYSCPLLG